MKACCKPVIGDERQDDTAPDVRTRLAWLRSFRRGVSADRDNLCTLIERDMGKPRHDALVQDIVPLLAACVWLERRATAILRGRRLGWGGVWTLGQSHRLLRVPLGHVGIIATWNYPVQLLGVQLIQALVAGNRVTVKPSENAPLSQMRLLKIAVESGDAAYPPLWWTAPTREAGGRMLRESRFNHVVFTGSTGVGRSIAQWAAETLTPTTLELSGNDSAFVLADADTALAAKSIWAAITMNAGQTCMAPHRAFVLRPAYRSFIKALSPLAAGARPADLVNESAAARVWDVTTATLGSGTARSLSGVAEPPIGRCLTPVALVDCRGHEPAVMGEHFGPLLSVVPVDSVEESLRIHRGVPQHLSASIYTRNTGVARGLTTDLASRLGTGIVTINNTALPTAHPALAITGNGESGWGTSRGTDGLLAMTRALYVSATSPTIRPPVDPLTARMASAIGTVTGWLYGNGISDPARNPRNSIDPPAPDESSAPVPSEQLVDSCAVLRASPASSLPGPNGSA